MESGTLLKEMTESALVKESVQLVTSQMQNYNGILNARIFKQIAIFLREMSNDNTHAKDLYSEELNNFMNKLTNNAETIDFYWNLLQFHMNVVF